MSVVLYGVGGYIRDGLLGRKSKDIDFAVEADSYETMRRYLVDNGFTIFLETPEFFTIRARFPVGNWNHGMPQWLERQHKTTADFVLCRKDGAYSDGRRPDSVEAGTILDDLARRDFTMNAIAKAPDGTLIDPHNGESDLRMRLLRCVGNPEERIGEDALRALRAIRFSITHDLLVAYDLNHVLEQPWVADALASVSVERVREELLKAFRHDTMLTLGVLCGDYPSIARACFAENLWLMPTLRLP